MRREAGKPVEGTVPVANALPLGWSDRFLAPTGMAQYPLGTGAGFRAAASSVRDIPSFLSRKVLKSPTHAGRGDQLASMGAVMAEAGQPPEPAVIFSGVPLFVGDEAVLFDSSRDQDADTLPESATIRLIQVRFPENELDSGSLDPGLALVVFVGDLASPRATVRLVDMVRRRGQRPLNVAKAKGDVVRIILADPGGAWSHTAPVIEVALAW